MCEFLSPVPDDPGSLNDQVAKGFTRHFSGYGYQIAEPVNLISRIDPSVRFIGSTISALKPLLIADEVPVGGICLVQPALRTQNADVLLDPARQPQWTSYFRAMGTLVPVTGLAETVAYTWRLLVDVLDVDPARAILHGSETDRDIVDAGRAHWPGERLTVPGEAPAAYRHKYGLAGISGRNANIAITDRGGVRRDIGNIIVIERGGEPIAVEVAIGVGTVLAAIHRARHPAMTSTIGAVMAIDSWPAVRLADALSAAVAMFSYGLRPGGRGRGRTMRRYLTAVDVLGRAQGLPATRLAELAAEFQSREFPGAPSDDLPGYLLSWLEDQRRASS